ncbi:hypothetical protein BGZ91_001742 [Linnemannia elongata]|nr:hypothetical protein BGZ91_001742 [Linnemannia elongata]
MVVQDVHTNVQGVCRVYESGLPSSSSETMYLVCHPDPSLNKDILLWDDILAVFSSALYVRCGATVLPFAKGPDFKNLDPLRITAVPGVTLDVVIRDQLFEKELSLDTLQQALPDSPQEYPNVLSIPFSNATIAAGRRNPVGGLVEEAMQNYNHIDNPATLPPRRGPQTTQADQTSPDNTAYATNSSNNSTKHPGAPQERSSTGTLDFTETVMNARLGDKHAQNTLGEMYKNGRGDFSQAMDWYLKAANQGHAGAQCSVGILHYFGKGVPQDYSQAMDWFLKAANQGQADAQCSIGLMYKRGQGAPQDYSQAMDWFLKAVNQGHAAAQCNVGLLYGLGQGVPQDYSQAMDWLLKAANQGHAVAQCNIGILYEYGRGVPQDYSRALEWYQRSADQGDDSARYNIGRFYELGLGIPEDKAKAMEWYKKAADNGHANSRTRFDRLKEQGYSPKLVN